MVKRRISYTDYDGTERTEDFYFNITEAEMYQLEASEEGGLSTKLQKLIDSPNGKEIMQYVNEIIMTAYGEKSADGRRFIKSPELSKAFSETPAYNQIFLELVLDAKKAADFVTAVLPKAKAPTSLPEKVG